MGWTVFLAATDITQQYKALVLMELNILVGRQWKVNRKIKKFLKPREKKTSAMSTTKKKKKRAFGPYVFLSFHLNSSWITYSVVLISGV